MMAGINGGGLSAPSRSLSVPDQDKNSTSQTGSSTNGKTDDLNADETRKNSLSLFQGDKRRQSVFTVPPVIHTSILKIDENMERDSDDRNAIR